MKLFTFNKKDVAIALEQIFCFFQMKKEETKSSTCSNLSNYSSIDGNAFNKNRIFPPTMDTKNEKFQRNKFNNFQNFDNFNIIDTNTNLENFNYFNGDHNGEFFMMDNFR
jgi:hypothetical protein